MALHERMIGTTHGPIAIVESSGKGPPVLFIHGNSSCREVFRHQLGSDLAGKYRMIAMDLPGHGQSADARDPEQAYTQPAYAEAAIEVLHACGAADAVVVGWSLGGHIGIEMIPRLATMTALSFSGTPPAGPGAAEVGQAFTAVPELSFTGQEVFSDEDAETYACYTCGLVLPPDPVLVGAVKRTDGRARRIMWQTWTTGNVGCPQIRTVEGWPKPIAVIQGTADPFMSIAYLDRIRFANLWGGRVHAFEGVGHAPFWERPAEYNALLARFLADVTGC
jgi:pimeloyl-ACP methyl ester carboxylesterase